MGTEIIDMARVSSRGQVAIPSQIREALGLEEGNKLVFIFDGENLIIKKASAETFLSVTEPLRNARKKINESEVVDLIHRIRNEARNTRH
ncbi:MAG: AbrB/MazE/SpoVT family DNA-binding domain-containing protein [Nanoarchaeota archaeon]